MSQRTWTGATNGDPNVATNWLEGYVPTTGDDLYFEDNAVDMDTNLEILSGTVFGALKIAQSYTGKIGNANLNGDYFKGAFTSVDIGYGYTSASPGGSQRVKVHLEDTGGACVVTVHNTAGSSADANQDPVRLKIDAFAGADATVQVRKGRVTIADQEPGETSTIDELLISYVSNRSSDARVNVGEGTTVATVTKTGGKATIQCAVSTLLENHYGDLAIEGAGAIATLRVEGGNVRSNTSGTITTLDANGGLTDLTQSAVARNVTTLNRRGSGVVKYDPSVVTVGTLNAGGPVKLSAA